MLNIFLISAALISLAIVGLAIGVIVKGKFPETHVGHNAEMKKLGITCAKNDSTLCQGRSKSAECRGCGEAVLMPSSKLGANYGSGGSNV